MGNEKQLGSDKSSSTWGKNNCATIKRHAITSLSLQYCLKKKKEVAQEDDECKVSTSLTTDRPTVWPPVATFNFHATFPSFLAAPLHRVHC